MRESVLLLTAFGLLAFGYVGGVVQPIYAGDSTGIVWGISGLALMGTVLARWRRGVLRFLCSEGVTMTLGLLGTVLGFIAALSGVVSGDEILKLDGVRTALFTTAAGIVGHLWLMLVREATR